MEISRFFCSFVAPQYISLIPSFNSCKTWLLIHTPILKENLNMRRKEEPEKTDNIYTVCLRKSSIDSQLKEQKWVWKKALCAAEDNIYIFCSVKAQLTVLSPPEWSCHLRLVFFWPTTWAFISLANFVFALKIVSSPLKRGQKPRETRLFAWLMVKE